MQVKRRSWRRGAIVLMASLLFLPVATSSTAHEPSAHRLFNPSHQGDGTGGNHGPDPDGESIEAEIMSDWFDGLNETYILRSVASSEASYYEWYLCGAVDDNPYPPPFGQGECGGPVARDDNPTFSSPPPGAAPVAAFSAPLAIDPSMEGGRFVKGVACIEGPPSRPAHCRLDTIHAAHLDDAQSTSDHPPTDSGEFTQPAHGAVVLNSGFTAVVFTAASDIGRMFFCLDVGTSPTTGENATPTTGCDAGSTFDATPNDSPACGAVPPGALCWEVTIDPPDNTEFSLAAVEQDNPDAQVSSGSGDCEGDSLVGGDGSDLGDDCQLDKIYLTSLPTIPEPAGPPTCPGFKNDKRNQIVGTKGADELLGSKGPDVICGLGGKDVIRGKGGKDVLLGGGGPDRLFGGPGNDLLKGGPKNDRLNGGPGKDRCRGGPGNNRLVSCER